MLNLTVTEFNAIMADIVHNQLQLNQLCISGEISQMNYYSKNTHLYLTLIHGNASLQCVVYNQHLKQIPHIQKGDKVQIIGQCRFLKNKGQLTFSGVAIQPLGHGAQSKTLEALHKKLLTNGSFAKKIQTMIPKTIYSVCIITGADSAAFHDMQSIINQSLHPFHTRFIPSLVQGLLAPQAMMDAIDTAIKYAPDIICICRGGGAENDFSCFNDEPLVVKVANTNIPVITGIGHQVNQTLCCLAANQAFETPTAVAQFLCTHSMIHYQELKQSLFNYSQKIHQKITSFQMENQTAILQVNQLMSNRLNQKSNEFKQLLIQLNERNPINKLNHGFNYLETTKKIPITSVQQIAPHDTISITLNDGSASALIHNVH